MFISQWIFLILAGLFDGHANDRGVVGFELIVQIMPELIRASELHVPEMLPMGNQRRVADVR